jgi:hypothetical protein
LCATLATAERSPTADDDWLDAMRVVQHQLHAATTYLADVLRNAGPKPGRRRNITVLKRRSRKWHPRLQAVHAAVYKLVSYVRRLQVFWTQSEWSLFRVCTDSVNATAAEALLALAEANEALAAPATSPTPHPPQDLGHDGPWPRTPGHARLVYCGEFSFMGEAVDRALALIRGGQDQSDAVRSSATELGVDPVRLALRVGGELAKAEEPEQ